MDPRSRLGLSIATLALAAAACTPTSVAPTTTATPGASLVVSASAPQTEAPTPIAKTMWTLLAVGDSVTTAGSETGDSYPQLLAAAISAATGVEVDLKQVTTETTADALAGLAPEGRILELAATADIVTLTVGANDANFDDVLPSGTCAPGGSATDCLAAFNPALADNLDAIVHRIVNARAGKRTVIAITSPDYNPFIGLADAPTPRFGLDVYRQVTAAEFEVACEVAARYGAQCIDLVKVFNGPDGTDDAKAFLEEDHLHPSRAGRAAIAAALFAIGLDPR
jgi:lysophospholipase L1-like esterase